MAEFLLPKNSKIKKDFEMELHSGRVRVKLLLDQKLKFQNETSQTKSSNPQTEIANVLWRFKNRRINRVKNFSRL